MKALAQSCLLGLAAFACARAAPASDAMIAVRLELEAPPGCASVRDLMEALQSRNGRVRLAAGEEPAAALRLIVSETQRGYRGSLEVRSTSGTTSSRVVEGDSCRAVTEALSLSAALALRLAAAEANPDAPPAKVETTAPIAAAPQEPRRHSSLNWQVALHALMEQPMTQHVNAGLAILGRVRCDREQSLGPSLSLGAQSSDSELVDSSRRASIWLTGIALTACPVTLAASPTSALRLEPCARGVAALLRASGHELSDARTVTRSWWGLGALARLSLRVARDLAVELEGGALFPLVERRFVALPSGTSLGRTSTVAPFASAGLAYAL